MWMPPESLSFVGQQVVKIVLRICADTLEHIAQIFKGIQAQAFVCALMLVRTAAVFPPSSLP
jgi:hypothetical protein